MSKSAKFTDIMNSYTDQAGKSHCLADYTDHFHETVLYYFRSCEDNNTRATISGLKKAIIENAESELFKFN